MMWKLIKAAIAFALIFVAAVFTAMFIGPTMKEQEHLRSYQWNMPLPPEGSVPVKSALPKLPTTQQALKMASDVPATPASAARGRVYYQYYCLACHGDAADGRGPVGEAFVPTPADLHSPAVQSLADGQLYRAMLTGVGHEPVMEYTVLPEHRWYLVAYLRSLGR